MSAIPSARGADATPALKDESQARQKAMIARHFDRLAAAAARQQGQGEEPEEAARAHGREPFGARASARRLSY